MDITGHALIVGGGSGIGKGCALAFAREGAASVVVADIDLAAAEKSSAECKAVASRPGFESRALHMDVTLLDSVEGGVAEMCKVFGRIDYCVNCAGVS
ncbi:hypothetical protein CDD81_7706 [Ophiocordyceps australis]|uniref:Uncharacterized protein n=1 Tax=Ophiocordyceps australis TaxID=1399860 RepID=A0A2C5XZU1_9HYPO|nr:hypothetical protein CDD81_7706 [Ophiocordyceps australis]